MFQQIVVPLDGSARAEQALPIAIRLARASNGTVILMQAVYPPTEFLEAVGAIMLPDLLDEKVSAAKEYLEATVTKLKTEDVHAVTKVVTGAGHAARAIITEAMAHKVDVIVMCSHGYTGDIRWRMGSVAEKVVRHASSPVFLLQEGRARPTATEPDGSVRVLVPLDGSEHAEASLVPATLLAWALSTPARGEVHVMRVVSPQVDQEGRERSQQYLRSLVEHRQKQVLTDTGTPLDVAMTWSVTVENDPASGIVHTAENSIQGQHRGYQVIAMSTHGLSGPQLWAMGSTTERVLQVAPQPLFIVPR